MRIHRALETRLAVERDTLVGAYYLTFFLHAVMILVQYLHDLPLQKLFSFEASEIKSTLINISEALKQSGLPIKGFG